MQTRIVAAAGVGLQTLFAVFRDLGVDEHWVLTSTAGESFVDDSTLDFITAVFSPLQPSPSESAGSRSALYANLDIALRAGQAAGQRLPVLLIVPPPLQPPTQLPGAVIAPCPLDDQVALRLHIWAFISTLQGGAQPVQAPPTPATATVDVTYVLERLADIERGSAGAGQQVEHLVASLLHQAGAELVASDDADVNDNDIDLAFLPSREASEVVLVEVKAGLLKESGLIAAEQQLQQLVMRRQASLGLLLYHDFADQNLPTKHVTPLVIRLSVRQLAAGLASNSLTQLLGRVVQETIRRM